MTLYSRWQAPIQSFTDGENVRRAKVYSRHALRSAPSFTLKYLREKVPVVEWLPRYSFSWLIRDIIAGLTIGILLVPQSLAYAKVANIPQQYGLMSSWIPTALYVILGTSKGRFPRLWLIFPNLKYCNRCDSGPYCHHGFTHRRSCQ